MRDYVLAPVDHLSELVSEGKIAPTAAILYIGLLRYMKGSGSNEVWPSRQTLARNLGMSRPQSVDRYLTQLQEAGLIEIENRRNPTGGVMTNCYKLLVTAN